MRMIKYIERSRAYYGAQGYDAYSWAHFEDVPFCAPKKPLTESRLALITTAAPFREDLPDQGPGAAYNAAAKFFEVYTAPVNPAPDLRISHIGYDRVHCKADDARTWLPLEALEQAQSQGSIGEIAPRLIGAPTNRSQRRTSEQDAPECLAHCRDLDADVVLLVPT